MIDLHSHILPGLDDGARTLEESRDIARLSAAEGVTAIAATPHVRDDHPTTADEMERGVDELRRDFAENGIAVDVLHGGELDIDWMRRISLDGVRRFTFGQDGAYLLVEFPFFGWPLGLEQVIFDLRTAGITPLLAHPERNDEVKRNPARVERLVAVGALTQVTAASLDGRIGRSARAASERLLELGLVHVLASDVHNPDIREAGMTQAARALGDRGLVRYLTEEAPAAIVAGEPVPPPPAARKRRRVRFF